MGADQVQLTNLYLQGGLLAVQILTLVGLVFYVVHTARMAKASAGTVEIMRDTWEGDMRPYIVPSIDGLPSNRVDFVLKNHGRTPAVDVAVEMDPEPAQTQFRMVESILRRKLRYVPPGWERRAIWMLGPDLEDQTTTSFCVRVRYRDTEARDYDEEYQIDLEDVHDNALLGRNPLNDIAHQIMSLEKPLWDVRGALQAPHGLPVRVVSDPRPARRRGDRTGARTAPFRAPSHAPVRHHQPAPWERKRP